MTRVLSDYKIKKIMRFLCADITASKTAILTGINRNTINRYFNIFRLKIAGFTFEGSLLSGEIELDKSYFGARRIWGKRACGAAEKNACIGGLSAIERLIWR